MARVLYKVLVADAGLLAAAYLIIQDIGMRVSCTLSGCTPFLTRTSATYSYSILTKTFVLDVNGSTLTSPPTLDWIQVLGLGLLLVNLWCVYSLMKSRKAVSSPKPLATVAGQRDPGSDTKRSEPV